MPVLLWQLQEVAGSIPLIDHPAFVGLPVKPTSVQEARRQDGCGDQRGVVIARRTMIFNSAKHRGTIPDKWWFEADMTAFIAWRAAYRAEPHARLPLVLLTPDEIELPPRGPGVPEFGRERMLRVLTGIRTDQALPPVEVERVDAAFPYRLYNGRHRFCASIAAGFSLVPAIVVDMSSVRD